MLSRPLAKKPNSVADRSGAAPSEKSSLRTEAYSIERVTSVEEFQKLKEDWDGVLNEHTLHEPYLEHEWFELWLKHYGAGGELSFFLVKQGQHIAAIFPFVLKRQRYGGLRIRLLEFLGNIGYAMRTPIFSTDDPSEREAILDSLFQFLVSSAKWDALRLNFLPEEDFDFKTLQSILSTWGLTFREQSWFGDWYLDGIDCTGAQYVASRVSHVGKNIKRFAKRFGPDGQMKIEIVTGGDDETIDGWMDHFHAVYRKSWKEWEVHPTFDRALAKMASRRGCLRLGFLFVGPDPVAAQFWFVYRRKAYFFKSVYNEQFKKFSPGVTLTAAMSTHVIDHDKAEEIDYLYGDNPYKKDWVPKRRERKNIFIFNNHSLRGALLSVSSLKLGPIMGRNRVLRPLRKGLLKLLKTD